MTKSRGVGWSGEHNGRAKLTAAQVKAVRLAMGKKGATATKLAKKYGVEVSTITRAAGKQTWRKGV